MKYIDCLFIVSFFMVKQPVQWNGYFLTEMDVYDATDWKGQLPPGKQDFERIHIYQAREALFRALAKSPHCPNQDSPGPHPWVQTVLKCICKTVADPNDRLFEEKVIQSYLHKFGMDQLLEIYGINIHQLKQEINNMVTSQ